MHRRFEHEHQARFLTFSCYKRFRLFVDDDLCRLFVKTLEMTRERREFELYAFVIMPDHVHLLLKPTTIDTISKILVSLKKSFSHKALQTIYHENPELHCRLKVIKSGREIRRFWQAGGGYDRNLHREETLRRAMDYIHLNPVRKGLVLNPQGWKWSSARFWIENLNDPMRMDIPKLL